MPPPDGFRIEISKLEQRYSWLIDKLNDPLEQQITADKFKEFSEEAHRIVFGKVTYDESGSHFEEPVVDDQMKDDLATESQVEPEQIKYVGLRAKAIDGLNALLRSYHGKLFDHETRSELAWRVAAGYKVLKMGQPLSLSITPSDPEWVGFRIDDVRFGKVFKGQKGPVQTLDLNLRILSGKFSGLRFRQMIPYRYVLFKMARDIGFPAFKKLDKSDLVLAYFSGMLDTQGKYGPAVTEFHASESLKKRNKLLYAERRRPCIKGYDWPCSKCTIGHKSARSLNSEAKEITGQCSRATHSSTYLLRPCSRCKKDGYFDPSENEFSVCIKCRNSEVQSKLKVLSKG